MLLLSIVAMATHNRAGEITYEQIGELTIKMTITTYTKTSSSTADRDSLEVFWGDGTSEFVIRTFENNLPNDVKINKYEKEHTYPGRSSYTIYFEDPNRVSNILNINPPNSVEVPFFLSTTFTFLDPQFQGTNNSAVLLQPPLDIACPGQLFIHNPNAYDSDGDSLAYSLVTPLMSDGMEVPLYSLPSQIGPGLNNQINMNEITGDFIWNTPQLQGEYNIAIRIDEFRNGELINTIIRDMQILVKACDNTPPVIDVMDEICVVAGELIDLPVMISDVDEGQKVILTASGGPFVQSTSSAILQVIPEYLPVPYTARLRWQTTCDHISAQYYQIVFRAADNGGEDSTGLATLKTLRIKVVGPPPENLDAESVDGNIRIHWQFPYPCIDAQDNYFQGFSVWRREGSNSFDIDTCQEGLAGRGYAKIVFNTNNQNGSEYIYVDSSVEKGKTYCYRVLGEFSRLSPLGFRYNNVGSLPSNEICAQVSRDIPLITKVSVDTTDVGNGQIHFRWTKPLAEDLDTVENAGPYRYDIQRSTLGQNNFSTVNSISSPFFNSPIDTNFIDTGINTKDIQFNYQILFYNGAQQDVHGTSAKASSIYITATPGDEKVTLNWTTVTPWDNYFYELYKIDPNGDTTLLRTFNTEETWIDRSVNNDEEYCYFVEALGSYGLKNIEDPLQNKSQTVCIVPVDNEPPCELVLKVNNVCGELNNSSSIDEFSNILNWQISSPACETPNLLGGFKIYYAANMDDELQWIDNESNQISSYTHFPDNGILGCYAVTAMDMVGNESMFSNIVCVDNCPLYELPNIFTPNEDGTNDRLTPRINRFVSRVEFSLFNEWGNKIYETSNPMINWDGKHSNGNDVPAGTYYYTCKVFENRVTGELQQSRLLRGYIHIVRS